MYLLFELDQDSDAVEYDIDVEMEDYAAYLMSYLPLDWKLSKQTEKDILKALTYIIGEFDGFRKELDDEYDFKEFLVERYIDKVREWREEE